MAIEITAIEQGLTDRGIDTALAPTFNFETEEQMIATLDSIKPRTFSSIEDVLKDEKLSAMVRTYRDKQTAALQSENDRLRLPNKDDKTKKDDKTDKSDTPDFAAQLAELLNPIKQELSELKTQKQTNDFEATFAKVVKAADITDDELIQDIKESLSSTATEADIKSKVDKKKAFLAKMGIKQFGTPGGGGGDNKGEMAEAMKAWNKKQELKKKK